MKITEKIEAKKDKSIIRCLKDYVSIDNSHIPKEIRDQESDGNVVLEFSDNTFYLFAGITENNSVEIYDSMEIYNFSFDRFTDISNNKRNNKNN